MRRLRARIAELERAAKTGKPAAPVDTAAIEQRGYQRGLQDGQRAAVGRLKGLRAAVHKAVDAAMAVAPEQAQSRASPAPATSRAAPAVRQAPLEPHRGGTGERLPPGETAVLSACIQFPDGLRREQLTVLTGYKRSSRDAYIQRLREKGYVEARGDTVSATQDGLAALPDAEPLPTGHALQDYWFQRLPPGERAILKVLVERYPNAVPRDELSELTKYERSSRDAYLQRLGAKQLVVMPSRGEAVASHALF